MEAKDFTRGDKVRNPKLKRLGIGIVSGISRSGKTVGVVWVEGINPHTRNRVCWSQPHTLEKVEEE